MMKRLKILFIYDFMHTTFENDIEILKKDFEVETYQYSGKKNFLKMLKAIRKNDINISRFVLGHATLAVLISKLLGKKSIVVAEGWDVVNMPEIGYGALISKKRVRNTKFALKHADAVVAISESIRKDVLKLVKREVTLIYHCLDSEKFKPKGKKDNMAITVGLVRKDTLQRKGLKTFVESAKLLPEIEFVLIGRHMDETADALKKIATPNVKFEGFAPHEKLMEYYQKAKVYVQVSAHEGFGISLTEAMLCECVPVVTDRGAIPEVVGDCGIYVPYNDPKSTANGIKNALDSDLGRSARKRIENEFTIEKRQEKLKALIHGLVSKTKT